jgi:hypothetical protein
LKIKESNARNRSHSKIQQSPDKNYNGRYAKANNEYSNTQDSVDKVNFDRADESFNLSQNRSKYPLRKVEYTTSRRFALNLTPKYVQPAGVKQRSPTILKDNYYTSIT